MDAMQQMPDKCFELAIVDPPYGINVAKMAYTQEENRPCKQKNGSMLAIKKLKYKHGEWDSKPTNIKYLVKLQRVSIHQIIWGINYMDFHLKGGRIIWNKYTPEGTSFSDCEIAYVSTHERVRLVNYMWAGMCQGKSFSEPKTQQGNKKLNEKRIHPTQKPVALYSWLLKNYAKPGDRILDTHLGSQSSRIACFNGGFEFVGFELDADYFRDGCKRFDNHVKQFRIGL